MTDLALFKAMLDRAKVIYTEAPTPDSDELTLTIDGEPTGRMQADDAPQNGHPGFYTEFVFIGGALFSVGVWE